jgi:uncharacterized SAM-binding protein YcdF (DUF218 family)
MTSHKESKFIAPSKKTFIARGQKKLLTILTVLAFLCVSSLFLLIEIIHGHKELDELLMKRLIRSQTLAGISNKLTSEPGRIIYVLGGSQKSLSSRFQTAAELYRHGLCDKILFISNFGITEYNPVLERNLTNDEWALNKLVALGVNKIDIEAVSFHKGFFGTLTEAKGVADLAANRGYRYLILVTSQYHTARTWLSFSTVMKRQNVTLSICGSKDDTDLTGHLFEYLKLVLYHNFVLPLYSYQLPAHISGPAGNSSARRATRING